ncbi:sulfotransferase family 2 domain-containing protein [Maricaulis sp. D1M11]|uniref:sulfotransferase family 2 domain-containing protein n=1 Tax=Maricaulis sp. D1M11 TaxID=3076117 RepID=UPI0039B6AAC0
MLILDEKHLFIHMHKCAGTSVCRAIIDQVEPERVEFFGYTVEGEQRSATSKRNGSVWKHSTAQRVRKWMGEERWANLENVVFASVRSPFDRAASFFFYAKRHNLRDKKKYPMIADSSFTDFIFEHQYPKDTIHSFVESGDGTCLVNHFLKFDDIENSFNQLCEEIGIGQFDLPTLNANPSVVNYDFMYGRRERMLIAKMFRREIKDYFPELV